MCVLPHVLLCRQGSKILGCQAVGEGEGVDKVVDVMATLIQKQGSVYDLEEAELCYAPQVGYSCLLRLEILIGVLVKWCFMWAEEGC